MLQQRILTLYSENDRVMMNLHKTIFKTQLKVMELTGQSSIYPNHIHTAKQIVANLKNPGILNTMVLAKTQSGKTGSMCATIKMYLEGKDTWIPVENIFIITGMSSCEWKQQTQERFPEILREQVFHRAELPKTLAKKIREKTDILILMDEIQVAAKNGQTLFKFMENAGILDKSVLYEKNIKIVEFTATPDGTIYDLMKWGDASAKILAQAGQGYVGAKDLLERGRVKQYKDLCQTRRTKQEDIMDNIRALKADIDLWDTPLYHIIRTRNGAEQGKTAANLKLIFPPDKYHFLHYDTGSDSIEEDINRTLARKPLKHTFIFIKEMLRCAKTLTKTYLGILYDRSSQMPDDATMIQGLIGRCTGYDTNGKSICYTNVDSVKRYEELWKSGFEDMKIKWQSKTTQTRKGLLCGKHTFNDPVHFKGFQREDDSVVEEEPGDGLIIKKFKTQEEAKEYWKQLPKSHFGKSGPRKRQPNAEGFYEATIGKGADRKRVYSTQEVNAVRKWALNESHHYTFYPCYENKNDPATLQWWLIHYNE